MPRQRTVSYFPAHRFLNLPIAILLIMFSALLGTASPLQARQQSLPTITTAFASHASAKIASPHNTQPMSGMLSAPFLVNQFFPLISKPTRLDRIAFISIVSDTLVLSAMYGDGSSPTIIAPKSCTGWSLTNPLWSPDNQQIVFEGSGLPGEFSTLCVINVNGTDLHELPGGSDRQAAWSPDGRRLVFVANGLSLYDEHDPDIVVVDVDGSHRTILTTSPGRDYSPAWSPDGQLIAYVTETPFPSSASIYLIRPDGSGKVRLTHNQTYETSPAWSPDGQRLAFTMQSQDGFDLYVIQRDGQRQIRLTNKLQVSQPSWSPDGTQLAFLDLANGRLTLSVINADGSHLTRLSEVTNFQEGPNYAWSPDGRQLIFERYGAADTDATVRVINRDGTGEQILANGFDPAWTH